MSDHSGSDTAARDITTIDKKKLLRAEERRKRANDEYGNIEDYLSENSNTSDDDGSEEGDAGSSSDSDVEEDENGELITPELDVQIMKTLSALRSKDKSLYDSDVNFFSEGAIKRSKDAWKSKQEASRQGNTKAITLSEYQHKINVEHGGVVDEDDELRKAVPSMTHVEEQEALKTAFKEAAHSDESDAEDDLLVKKEKSKEESVLEDVEYRKFLLESVGGDLEDKEALKGWASTVSSSGEPADSNTEQTFLMNYILNRGWMNQDVGPAADELEAKAIVDKEEDDDLMERADKFENQYNFRFSEEGGTQIKTYSREIEGSLRRKDSRRKLARERAKERKAERKQRKAEELKQLKNQKKKDILEKLKEIQGITGNKSVGFDMLDLDGDFDPANFDMQMQQLFANADQDQDDSVKPTWEDDIDIGDIVSNADHGDDTDGFKKGQSTKPDVGDDDFIMDADYLYDGHHGDAIDHETLEATAAGLKDKVSEYMDKNYQLEFEDIIGDGLPTRFKYTKVRAVDYGLTPAEILLADDNLLNDYASVKRIAAYRPDWKIDDDISSHTNRKRMIYIKKKAAAQRKDWESELKAQAESASKKRSAKAGLSKKSKKSKTGDTTKAPAIKEDAENNEDGVSIAKKKSRRQRKKARAIALEQDS
ncbi:Ribosome biogenesis protein Kri1 [Coemansia sp. RSA 1365]|nr:Ribosome biogenesis protein Kri1 [Coemansia sp. RSA 1365]